MAFGFGQMRLSPDQFWSMTPAELAMVMRARGLAAPRPMSQAELAALAARFPDEENNHEEAHATDG